MKIFIQNLRENWLEYLFVVIVLIFLELIFLFLAQISWWLVLFFGFSIILTIIFYYNFSISLFFILIAILAGQLIRLKIPGSESGAILLTDLVIPLVVLAWILRRISENKSKKLNFLTLPIAFFVAIATFSLIINFIWLRPSEFLFSFFYLVRWVIYAGLYFVVADEVKKEGIKKILWWLVIAGLIFAIAGLYQYINFPDFRQMAAKEGWDPHMYRVLSSFFDPNFAGGFLAVIILLILELWLQSRTLREKFWLFLIFCPVILAFILTYSRSSYLALFFMLAVVGLIRIPKFFLLSIFIGMIIFLAFPKAIQRIQGARTFDVTASARIISWKRTWQIISDQPVLGVGYNAFSFAQKRYGFLEDLKVHSAAGSDSSFLTIWATTGFLGLMAYLIIWSIIIIKLIKLLSKKNSYQYFALIFLAIILGLFVHSQFVNSLLYPALMIYLWILIGLVSVIENPKS